LPLGRASNTGTIVSEGHIGVVLIGRNEGRRLVRALDSVVAGAGVSPGPASEASGRTVVYVDSGSTDGSRDRAHERGVTVVELDMTRPFTAARARNAGFERLRAMAPHADRVMFIDGDCEVAAGFVEAASAALDGDAGLVAVCGYRRERFPDRSVYNRVCDVEWRSGGAGECGAFGGDVMIRASALAAIGGYDETLIAGEDEEVGIRLRLRGGRLLRLDRTSTLHDADITRFSQWWTRARRAGHAYSEISALHGAPPERHWVDETRRAIVWGALVPGLALGLAPVSLGASLGLLSLYPLQATRIAWNARRRGLSTEDAVAWGASCALSKIPEAIGIAQHRRDRARGRRAKIIEYK
jgi:GT2 family glycosyltransferase